MLQKIANQGFADACANFGVKFAAAQPGMGFLSKAHEFGKGQWGALKSLGANLRGGLGGQHNPAIVTSAVPGANQGIARGAQRTEALSNLGTLAPSIGGLAALGAGAYALSGDSAEEKQRKAMMASRGY